MEKKNNGKNFLFYFVIVFLSVFLFECLLGLLQGSNIITIIAILAIGYVYAVTVSTKKKEGDNSKQVTQEISKQETQKMQTVTQQSVAHKPVREVKQAPQKLPQFVVDTKNQIDKEINKIGGIIDWNSGANTSIEKRMPFMVNVRFRNYSGTERMRVHLNKNGVTKIVFPDSDRADIDFIKKTVGKTPSKPVSQPKPKKPGNTLAEKSGNTITNKNGKPEVKPNYKMIATDWINANLAYLNKVCNDAMMACGGGIIHATLEAKQLPEQTEAWEAIAQQLKDQEEIDDFEIIPAGINITIE